jgi:NAD(P)H-dependent FMN reductase
MYTIIAGTSRKDSNSLKVGKTYQRILAAKGVSSELSSLEEMDLNFRSDSMVKFEKELLIPSKKFIFIVPEYNGSYPGVLKTLIDISLVKDCWHGKKALLTGVATGRGGNIRGMEHLTGCLNYLQVFVHPNRLPISLVHELMGEDGSIVDVKTLETIDLQITDFIKF